MNERIAELMRDHGLHKHISADCQHRMEMLAEVIIEDCIDNVKIWERDSRNHISYMLKNHFKVEE
jgi:hypothetical protein